MLEKTKLKFYRFLSAILLVVMLSMSGVMYVSAHGGDITLIHACVTNRTGAVRIVSPTATCDASKETALDWNIQGPKGDKGNKGEVGPMGPQGPAGPTGGMVSYYQHDVQYYVSPGDYLMGIADCNLGDQIISGGANTGGAPIVVSSRPVIETPYSYWVVEFQLSSGVEVGRVVTVTALCADTTP
jgi:hypothetical protein